VQRIHVAVVVASAFAAAALTSRSTFAAPAGESAALQAALDSGDENDLLDALEAAKTADDRPTVDLCAQALKSQYVAVRLAALDALGRMRNAEALVRLHAAYRTSTETRDNDEVFAALLQAIGRRSDPRSVDVLADDPFERLTLESGKARIMGLSRIRTKESLEALVAMSRKASPSARRGRGVVDSQWAGRFREAMRCCAVVLTGKDFGASRPDWEKWWNENKDTFKVSEQRPPVPADVRVYWERYWNEPYDPSGANPAPARLGAPFERIEKPSAELVKDAVDDLDDAFKDGVDADARVKAIEENADVVHPEVVREIARGLRDADRRVRLTAVRMLGWMKTADGLKQLHRMFRREKDLSKDEEMQGALLTAIGRHGDPSSVDVLVEDPFKGGLSYASGKARILGLANIRTMKSVEELFDAMKLGGGSSDRRGGKDAWPRFLDDGRLAVAVLTGVDLGANKDAWLEWWRENKRTFTISPQRPKIAPELEARWEAFWGEAY
jgi:HEAT repeat protein